MTSPDSHTVVAHILPVRQRDFLVPVLRPRSVPILRLASRSNELIANIIDEGIRRLLHHGSNAAVDFLCAHGISLRIIGRVLFHPHLRRPLVPH
jgi:hypothetical protein